MQSKSHFTFALVALATVFLIACQQTSTQTSVAAESKAVNTEKVFVIFEGPWAIVPDPKDTNSILAIAPNTKSHRRLAVSPASVALDAGVYNLAVPPHGTPAALNLDPGFFRATIDPKNVQHILDDHLERYAIRLPKPEGYVAAGRHRSRVSRTYPPDSSTEQNYVTSISLRYNVTTLSGFSLSGMKNVGGAFDSLPLQLDTPVVRFVIDPVQDFSADVCSNHSRQAFGDLVRMLGLTLYVDFPENPGDCHKKDPQVVSSEKAETLHSSRLIAGLAKSPAASVPSNILAVYLGVIGRKVDDGLAAVIYYFHSDGGGCMAPIIVGNG